MTVERNYETFTVTATADLSAMQFRAVTLAGLGAGTSTAAVGILRSKAVSGQHASVAYRGQLKAYAGAAINSGDQVGVTTSGWLVTVTTSVYVGRAIASAGSGSLVSFIGDFNMGQIA